MSKYTTQLRYIVEQTLKNEGKDPIESNWDDAVYNAVGLKDYPIFDEVYRKELNNKIIRHYYTREIGAETAGRFKLFVRDAMFLIMPYYNQLYESEIVAKNIEPLIDKNIENNEHSYGNATNESTGEGSSSNETQDVFSDTPNSEMIPAQIKNMEYATTVTLDNTNGTNTSSSSSSGEYDSNIDKTERGNYTSQSDLLNKYRTTFLNIDKDIVNNIELSHCFLTIW